MGIRRAIRSVLQGVRHWLEKTENQQMASVEPELVSLR